MKISCAECNCMPGSCSTNSLIDCKSCIKEECCCKEIHQKQIKKTEMFFHNIKTLYASALGIEILCIMSAEIGQNSSFLLFGFQTPFAVTMSYVLGYSVAGFTTFATILGRYDVNGVTGGCCSVLGNEKPTFFGNLKLSFQNAWKGMRRIPHLYKKPYFVQMLKASLIVLVTGESVCILTAETVNLAFFRHALWLSIPLSLLAGALAITIVESYKRARSF